MRLLHIGLILVCISASSQTFKIYNDDTIVIQAGEEDSERFSREVETTISTISDDLRSDECTTPRGKSGSCTSFRECYPNLLPVEQGSIADTPDKTGTYNQALAEILLNISGVCEGDEVRSDISYDLYEQAIRSEVLICCPSSSKTPPPLPPPANTPADEAVPVTVKPESDTGRNSLNCGYLKIDLKALNDNANFTGERIVNGREAARGEFPWIVAMMNNGREFCGGSLIDEKNVLTAAHCVQHMTAGDVAKLTLQIGDHNIYGSDDGVHETRTATKVLYNKGFSMKHLHHDIAIVRLNKPVSFTKYIQPICLHSGSPPYDSGSINADVAGWGQLRDNGNQPASLRTVNIRVWTQPECSTKYSGNAPAGIGGGMVCAGSGGKDSCRGDSGGPLTIDSRTQAKQVGIVSWGIGCGTYPGVYTRVDKYLAWINKNRN